VQSKNMCNITKEFLTSFFVMTSFLVSGPFFISSDAVKNL